MNIKRILLLWVICAGISVVYASIVPCAFAQRASGDLETRVDALESYVETIEPTLAEFSNDVQKNVRDYTKGLEQGIEDYSIKLQRQVDERLSEMDSKTIILNPASKSYQKIDTNTGSFFVFVHKMEPMRDGFRLHLRIGNPYYASFKNFNLKVVWGKKWNSKFKYILFVSRLLVIFPALYLTVRFIIVFIFVKALGEKPSGALSPATKSMYGRFLAYIHITSVKDHLYKDMSISKIRGLQHSKSARMFFYEIPVEMPFIRRINRGDFIHSEVTDVAYRMLFENWNKDFLVDSVRRAAGDDSIEKYQIKTPVEVLLVQAGQFQDVHVVRVTLYDGRAVLIKMLKNTDAKFELICAGGITKLNLNQIHNLIGAQFYHGR